jgi:hypothetical protein
MCLPKNRLLTAGKWCILTTFGVTRAQRCIELVLFIFMEELFAIFRVFIFFDNFLTILVDFFTLPKKKCWLFDNCSNNAEMKRNSNKIIP